MKWLFHKCGYSLWRSTLNSMSIWKPEDRVESFLEQFGKLAEHLIVLIVSLQNLVITILKISENIVHFVFKTGIGT